MHEVWELINLEFFSKKKISKEIKRSYVIAGKSGQRSNG